MIAHDPYLDAAIEEARRGLAEGGIPIGSVIVHREAIIGRGHNRRVQTGSPVLHGEMDALQSAGRQPARVYRESVLYTTLSPCAMCSGAILLYGIPKVVVGENRTFMGEEDLLRSRGVAVEVRQDETCVELMRNFIARRPELWNEDIGRRDKSQRAGRGDEPASPCAGACQQPAAAAAAAASATASAARATPE